MSKLRDYRHLWRATIKICDLFGAQVIRGRRKRKVLPSRANLWWSKRSPHRYLIKLIKRGATKSDEGDNSRT